MRVLRLLVVAAVCLILGAVVLADGRTEVVKLPPFFTFETVTTCPGGFDVRESFNATIMLLVQRDKNGDVVKFMQHGSTGGRSTYYNSVNPDINFVSGPEHNIYKVDYAHGKITMSGLNYKVTIPGGGMIFHQGGHYTFDLISGEWTQVGGPDDLFSGDFDALCQALTP